MSSLRRPRVRSLALLGIVVTLGIVGVYALTSEPLVSNGSGWIAMADQTADPGAPGETRYDFRFVPSGPITWGLGVQNTLLVPVTIRGLHAGSLGAAAPVAGEELHLDQDGSVPPDELQAFAPIDLAPGQGTFLAITERFTDCASARRNWIPGSALVQSELWLDVTVLGIPRVARVALPWGLAFDAPEEGICQAASITHARANQPAGVSPGIGRTGARGVPRGWILAQTRHEGEPCDQDRARTERGYARRA